MSHYEFIYNVRLAIEESRDFIKLLLCEGGGLPGVLFIFTALKTVRSSLSSEYGHLLVSMTWRRCSEFRQASTQPFKFKPVSVIPVTDPHA